MLIEKAYSEFIRSSLKNAVHVANITNTPVNNVIEIMKKIDYQLIDISGICADDEIADNKICFPFESVFIKDKTLDDSNTDTFIAVCDYPRVTNLGYIKLYENTTGKWAALKFVFARERNNLSLEFEKNAEFGQAEYETFEEQIRVAFNKINKISPQKTILYKTKPVNIKIKNRGLNFYEIIKKPIYIYVDKKEETRYLPRIKKEYKQLEKIISWNVRGHWRKLDNEHKRGKNAQGEYKVEGFTWVKPYIKGNKEAKPSQNLYIAI